MPVRVLYLTDFLRPVPSRGRPGMSIMAGMSEILAALFHGQIKWMITGSVDAVISGADPRFAFRKYYDAANMDVSEDAWAVLNVALPESVSNLFFADFNFDLVICWEVPGSLKDEFRARNIPFFELVQHPVRFMPDFMFGFGTNIAEGNDVADRIAIGRHSVIEAAGYVAAYMMPEHRRPDLQPGSTLFIGQKRVDRAMIAPDGTFLDGDRLRALVEATLADTPDPLYVSRHPDDGGDNTLIDILFGMVRDVRPFEGNVYAALASGDITNIVTVSSSVGLEAGFFGVATRYAVGPSVPVHFRGEESESGSYATLGASVTSTRFLADLLKDILPVRPEALALEIAEARFQQDQFRRLFGKWYAYQSVALDAPLAASGLLQLGAASDDLMPFARWHRRIKVTGPYRAAKALFDWLRRK